jgi:hypothetical protein
VRRAAYTTTKSVHLTPLISTMRLMVSTRRDWLIVG